MVSQCVTYNIVYKNTFLCYIRIFVSIQMAVAYLIYDHAVGLIVGASLCQVYNVTYGFWTEVNGSTKDCVHIHGTPHVAPQYARPKAKRGILLLNVNKFPHLRKQTRTNGIIPCEIICIYSKRHNRHVKLIRIILLQKPGEKTARRSILWRQRWSHPSTWRKKWTSRVRFAWSQPTQYTFN